MLPVTFMRLAGFNQFTVNGLGEARRRLVDLSLAIDCSGSIGTEWPDVRDAARLFINSFDATYDRISVTLFSDGAHVEYAMPSAKGFNKTSASNAVPSSLPGGSTSMADGFYRAYDEIRSVPAGSQSGLRVIVLFTDGTPNGVPGNFRFNGTAYVRELNTNDFPSSGSVGTNSPSLFGLAYQDCTSGPPPIVPITHRWARAATIHPLHGIAPPPRPRCRGYRQVRPALMPTIAAQACRLRSHCRALPSESMALFRALPGI